MTTQQQPLEHWVMVAAKVELVIPRPAMLRLAADLIVTAVEGGTSHWAQTSDYVWDEDSPGLTRARFHCEEGEFTVTVPAMIEAMIELLSGGHEAFGNFSYPSSYRLRLLSALAQIETGVDVLETDYDFDAEDASAMVQLVALGEVVY